MLSPCFHAGEDMVKEDNDFMFWWKYEDKNVKLIEAK